jgi:hypothetical protein
MTMSVVLGCSSDSTRVGNDLRRGICAELADARDRYFREVRDSSLMVAAAGLVQEMQAIRDDAVGTELETPARVAAAGGLRDVDDKSLDFARECVRLGLLSEEEVGAPDR